MDKEPGLSGQKKKGTNAWDGHGIWESWEEFSMAGVLGLVGTGRGKMKKADKNHGIMRA